MANVTVYNMEGNEVGTMEMNDAVFGVEINEHLVHLAVVRQLANNRQGTQKAKTRSEVRGGGRKPWRQKGTGHARQGSIRAPQWTGGGCTLPGKAMVLMPGAGYEGVTRFVLDVMTSYGLNACPPLLVGVGVATSVETAALLSKKALMRPLGSHNENERAASMEKLLEDGINEIGLGPQGMGGKYSVMGVHIENTARHPSAIGVAVNVGCWSHRRGHIIFDKDLNYTITTHSGVTL